MSPEKIWDPDRRQTIKLTQDEAELVSYALSNCMTEARTEPDIQYRISRIYDRVRNPWSGPEWRAYYEGVEAALAEEAS